MDFVTGTRLLIDINCRIYSEKYVKRFQNTLYETKVLKICFERQNQFGNLENSRGFCALPRSNFGDVE